MIRRKSRLAWAAACPTPPGPAARRPLAIGDLIALGCSDRTLRNARRETGALRGWPVMYPTLHASCGRAWCAQGGYCTDETRNSIRKIRDVASRVARKTQPSYLISLQRKDQIRYLILSIKEKVCLVSYVDGPSQLEKLGAGSGRETARRGLELAGEVRWQHGDRAV